MTGTLRAIGSMLGMALFEDRRKRLVPVRMIDIEEFSSHALTRHIRPEDGEVTSLEDSFERLNTKSKVLDGS